MNMSYFEIPLAIMARIQSAGLEYEAFDHWRAESSLRFRAATAAT